MKRFQEEVLAMSITDLIALKGYLDVKDKAWGDEGNKAFAFIIKNVEKEIDKRIVSWVMEIEHESGSQTK